MDVIAVYAAIVATGGLAWQVWTSHRRRRLICDVRTGLYTAVVAQGPMPGLLVEVINHSERPIRIVNVAFRVQGGGSDEWLVPTALWRGYELPFKVDAHDAGSVMYDRVRFEEGGMDWTEPVVAAVFLSTGERFESKPKPLAGSGTAADTVPEARQNAA